MCIKVRFRSRADIDSLGESVHPGATICYHTLKSGLVQPQSIYTRGYDASGINDEELPESQMEFSDDEAERAAKRKKPVQHKRGRGTVHPRRQQKMTGAMIQTQNSNLNVLYQPQPVGGSPIHQDENCGLPTYFPTTSQLSSNAFNFPSGNPSASVYRTSFHYQFSQQMYGRGRGYT